MAPDSFIVSCPKCGAKNRIPALRRGEPAKCGKCKAPLAQAALFPDHAIDVNDRTFRDEVLDFPGPAAAFFWATWCTYCRQLMPVFDELARELTGRIKFVKVITDQNQGLASEYDVLSLPTIMLFKNGRPVNRLVGALPKNQLEYNLRRLL